MDDLRKSIIEQSPDIEYDAIDKIVNIMDVVVRELPKGMPLRIMKEKAAEVIGKEFKNGNHRKMFGKKMRDKLNGRIITYHSKMFKTYLIFKLEMNKKGMDFDFSTINYTPSREGMIYIHRHMGVTPDISVFTAHFFDRLMERGYGENIMSREKAILTFLLDHMEVQKDYGFFITTASTAETMSYMLHGAAIGKSFWMNARKEFSFIPDEWPEDAGEKKIQVRFFLTYYSMDMLTDFQKKLITRGDKLREDAAKDPKNQVREFTMQEGD